MNKAMYLMGLLVGLAILIVLQWPGAKMQIIACDVGQGDGILITKGELQVIVDGGPSEEKMLSCLGEHMPFWDRTIELIVLTNTDYDHMNGLSGVIDRYKVMQFVTSDGVHSSSALDKFRSLLLAKNVGVEGVEQGDRLVVSGEHKLELDVLWPPEVIEDYVAVFSDQLDSDKREQILGASAKRGDLNERSVVLLILEDGKRYLLMGDVGYQAEKKMLEQRMLPDIDYLKVGHHGSKYASSLEFLQVVKPEIAVISVGAKNRYGHPTNESLERISKIGAVILRTDIEGSVLVGW